ncbi:hypothetical protein GGR50DRAFT_480062 [Xylaria sp. CBS 124048]|nr:hypothetical protein GGR50DRAFT_480062 [Xylaria sp. CBS 124048]
MMATAATVGGPVDVSVNEPSLNQPNATKPEFENVDRSEPALNGSGDDIENKHIAEIVDELVNSAEVSVSGGSDTEASKGDLTKSDEKGHARSSSAVKKTQSFKSVSVNRTFLASKSTASTSRPESAAGSTSTTPQPTVSSSASRLKLVAKSGSNLGGASKTLSANGKPSGAPDPNLVWNRNRVPPQPETKKRSDEELKHDGIHLADRLGPEDLKGQSNWADIDDDDEWAPDTITWTDGTKITLPPTEETAPSPIVQPAVIDKPKKDPILVPKTKSPVPISSATGSPSIKPGVLASGKGLVFKGAPEKPTLVAKPPTTQGPAKSPWAPLPPVEKVSPVVMELSSQPQPARYQLRDQSNPKSATPPLTKEIAADDFSRNYRDGAVNSSRELYNSQSGRYEPVPDRRGSRHDIHARQLALLQRPTHNEQQGPAEPSAAFQTSRSSVQDGSYSRRRGSSNVSGGSGHLAHRIGGRPHDMPPPPEVDLSHANQGPGFQRRASLIPSNAESSVPAQTFPANSQSNQHVNSLPPYQPLVSPREAHAVPHQNAYNQEIPQVDSDLEKAQKEYMRKKREEAVRRRMEEEQAEERAKQARIAEKLKALGPAPERKSARKEPPSVAQKSDIPPTFVARTKAPSAPRPTHDPAPTTASGSEVKSDSTAVTNTAPKELAETELPVSNGSVSRPMDYEKPRMPSTQSIVSGAHGQPTAPWSEASQNQDRFHQTWTSGHQNTSRNVWGAPGNDRSLGNGTFNADIGPLSDSHVGAGANMMHRPALMGPPLRPTPQLETQPSRLAPIGPPRAQAHISNAWKTFDIKADDERRRLDRIKQREALGEKASGPILTDTWRPVELNEDGIRTVGAPVKSHHLPTELREAEKAASYSEVGRQNAAPPPAGPSSQIRTGSRFFPASTDVQQHEASVQPSRRSKSPTPPPPTADGHPVYDGDATKPHVSLPPLRPRVKLPPSAQSTGPGPIAPPSKQSPVSSAPSGSFSGPLRAPDANISGRPLSRGRVFNGILQTPHEIASQETWQSKINSLMGKKSSSPPKSMPAGSSMMVPIELPRSLDSMDVPILSPSGTDWTEDSSFTSKEMAEECFGEQEMGSLPNVRLPAETPEAAWQAVLPDWLPAPVKLRIEPSGRESFKFGFDYVHGKSVIRILTPGMPDAKTVTAPVISHRSGSNPRRAAPRGGLLRHPHPSRGGRRGGARDTIERGGDHGVDHGSASSSRGMSSRGPRSYRPRGESWTRQGPSTSAAHS